MQSDYFRNTGTEINIIMQTINTFAEREELMRRILIDNHQQDPKECAYGFPWRHDSICYNFNIPDEFVMANDVDKIEDKADVETLVIGCDLDGYEFINDMVNLRQLYIYSGNNLRSTEFCRKLLSLRQLYIRNSHILSLEGLVNLFKKKKKAFDEEKDPVKRLFGGIDGICIESDCNLDGKSLLKPGLYISELIINNRHIST